MGARTYDKSAFKAIFHPKGYVAYNGFVFNELVKTKLEITPVENHARTGIKYEEYLFTIEAFVSPDDVRSERLNVNYDNLSNGLNYETGKEIFTSGGSPVKNRTSSGNTNVGGGFSDVDSTDANFRLLRHHLMTPGGDFIYGNKGAGEDLIFISNSDESWSTSGVRKDICFGPMPKILTFEPVAGNSFARIVFQVLVRFKTCSFTKSHGIVDFSLVTTIKTNSNGYKQINRKGYLEVSLPKIRTGRTAFNNSSAYQGVATYSNENRIEEKYKEILNSLIDVNMQGYKIEHEVNFAPDHRSCEFTIRYIEIESPNAYPNGVTKIVANHSTSSSLMGEGGKLEGGGFSKWLNSMSAAITLRPNVPPIKAWYVFLELLNERLQYDIDVIINHGKVQRIKIPMVIEVSLDESLFSHEYKFNIKWINWLENLSEVFNKTGMFKPIQSTNWFDWTADMRPSVNSADGAYPLVPGKHGSDYFNTSLCNNEDMNLHYSVNLETTRGYPPNFVYSLFGTKCPPESSSMVDYQEKFYVVGGISRSTYQRYDASSTSYQRQDNITDSPNYNDTFEMLDKYLDAPESSFFTQDFGRDQYKIVHRGYAIRLGYAFTPPKLNEIGGKRVELLPDADIISTQPKSTAGDCPMIVTTWERHYKIIGKPTGDLSRSNKQSGRTEEYQP